MEEQTSEAKALKDDILLKVLMKGLLPKIKDAMWYGRLPADCTWDSRSSGSRKNDSNEGSVRKPDN